MAVTPQAPLLPELPEGVRRHVAELAAAVLGELSGAEVPPSLVRVAAFTPARRARAGAGPLGVALDRDEGFRIRVAAAWRALHPDLAASLDAGEWPAATPPGLALAGVYLLRPPDWPSLAGPLADELSRAEQEAEAERSDAAARAELAAARAEGDRLRDQLAAERSRADALEEELAGIRREIRRVRSDADRARAAVRVAAADAATEATRAREAEQALDRVRREADERVRQAGERLESSRRADREGRSLADARLRLLLDTVVDAAAGLRRELALPPVDVRPADLVGARAAVDAAAAAEARAAAGTARASEPDDPAPLARLLALPRPHLVVDGYNVTKTGYGSLTLLEQRRRLVDSLAAVAARTGAEITCCFDGAEVDAPAASLTRGVRVMFSPPGVTADELVRRLVRAEPQGRVVVVVSSDQEVVRGVRTAGAHPVASVALLRYLARG